MVVFAQDGSLSVDLLRVALSGADGSTAIRGGRFDNEYRIPQETHLPASLAVRSNGDAEASVRVEASVWMNGVPLDARTYVVSHVPTEVVTQLTIVFSDRCSPHVKRIGVEDVESSCEGFSTCDPQTGSCESNRRDARGLPRHGSAEGTASARDAGDARTSDSAAPPAESTDASLDGAADATIDGSTDAPAPRGHDAAADAPSSLPPCEANATRCRGGARLRCDDAGHWIESPCELPESHCYRGSCVAPPPSCAHALGARCRVGSDRVGDCCASDTVPGGTIPGAGGATATTVSTFRLDVYEVTVGRFRRFVDAVVDEGWLPAPGSGKHTHLRGGRGVSSLKPDGDAESGWNPEWNQHLERSLEGWNDELGCSSRYETWTVLDRSTELLPVNCASWFDAYAFCIWDGGFLPTEAEWYFAAAGGAEVRPYPWGGADPESLATLATYDCNYGTDHQCTGLQNVAPVGWATDGTARWGQLDLAGSVYEWHLDAWAADPARCVDCANLGEALEHSVRGGAFFTPSSEPLRTAAREHQYATYTLPELGIRCARAP